MGFLKPKMPAAPAPPPPPANPPMFGSDMVKKKPQQRSMNTTFLGAETAPASGQTGQKTLLGQ